MSTNVTEVPVYSGRIQMKAVVNGAGYDLYDGITKVVTLTLTPHASAAQYARGVPYSDSAVIDLTMPLVGGGSHTDSVPLNFGLRLSVG